jgi:soluble lytic murein transglycosylase-like protein
MWIRVATALSQRPSRSAALAILGLSTCAAPNTAFAEFATKAAKSDKAVVIASLDWQPADPSGADWVAFKPGSAQAATSNTRSDASTRSTNPLNNAIDLFAQSEPVKLTNTDSFALRTASIDPDSAWIPGARQQTANDAPANTLPAQIGSNPTKPEIHLGYLVPIPRAKPPVPKVRLASLTSPTELPDAETHERALDAAPMLGEPKHIPEGATAYLDIFRREASLHKIPLWLALGVAWVESKFDPKLRGTHTVVGMMQVMPSTAREMGYRGTTNQLFNPETNIVWGMKELAKDYEIAKGDICLTIAKYKGGFRTTAINKGAWNYCGQVKRVTGMGVAVAEAKPQ